jgi:hypothetical protein
MLALRHLADGADRFLVGAEIALRVGKGARRLAEHVEARGEAGIFLFLHPPDRFVDGPAHDEDLAHQLHRRADRLPHERLADPADQALERARLLGLADQSAAYHQPPGRRVDQRRGGLALVRAPVRIAELVGDERVGRFRVRHAQERLGQREEGDPFGRVEPIFLQELVDPARRLRRPQLREHAQRPALHPPPRLVVERGVAEEGLQYVRLRGAMEAADFGAYGCRSVRFNGLESHGKRALDPLHAHRHPR